MKRAGPDSQPLVLISGWGQAAAMISPLLPEGGEAVQCWSLYDFPAACEMETPAQWLTEISARVPEQAVWIGWSLGGQLAMAAAERYPQQVAGVITVNSTPRFVTAEGWPCGRPRAEVEAIGAGCRQSPAKALRRFSALQVRGDRFQQAAREAMQAMVPETPSADQLNATLGWLEQLDQRDFWRHPGGLRRHHLFAARDPLVSAETPRRLGLPATEYQVIPDMAHWPFGPHLNLIQRMIDEVLHDWRDRPRGRTAGDRQ